MTPDQLREDRLRKQKKNDRDKKYRDETRDSLHSHLGTVCKKCGSSERLEFDVIVPVGEPKGHHGKMSSTSRMGFYKRQFEQNNLQVLCSPCNSTKRDTVDFLKHPEQLNVKK